MKINLKYFGMLADIVGARAETIEVEDSISTHTLFEILAEKHKQLSKQSCKMAVNQTLRTMTLHCTMMMKLHYYLHLLEDNELYGPYEIEHRKEN